METTFTPDNEISQSTPYTIGLEEKTLSQAIRERRATPAFLPDPVKEEDLNRILRAGLQAPSSYNMQPWRFVVVRDPEQRKRLRIAAMNQEQVVEAPVVIVACGDLDGWKEDLEEVIRIGRTRGYTEPQIERKRKNVTQDLESQPNMSMWVTKQTMIAATTMMWVAETLGYDTGPMEGFHENQVRDVLGIPQHVRVLFLLAIGHLKGQDGTHPGRLPTTRTVFADGYGIPMDLRVTDSLDI